jgi:hypothetical protein
LKAFTLHEGLEAPQSAFEGLQGEHCFSPVQFSVLSMSRTKFYVMRRPRITRRWKRLK